jgi:hypothetical protein
MVFQDSPFPGRWFERNYTTVRSYALGGYDAVDSVEGPNV